MQGGLGAPAFQQRTVSAGLSFLCLCQRQRFFAKIDFSSQRTVIYWRVFHGFFFSKRMYKDLRILSLTNGMTLWINLYMQ